MSVARPSLHLTAEPWLGVNFWSRGGGPLMWRSYDDALVRSELQVLTAHGVRLTRSFFYWPDFQPAPDTIDEDFVARYAQFLQANADLGMTTIPRSSSGTCRGRTGTSPGAGAAASTPTVSCSGSRPSSSGR